MPARIFLYIIAGAVVLLLLAGIGWTLFRDEIFELALVPDAPVEVLDAVEESAYADPRLWLARPDKKHSPTDWLPAGFGEQAERETDDADESQGVDTAADGVAAVEGDPANAPPAFTVYDGPPLPVFYVLPTTYLKRDRWNAPMRSASALPRQQIFASMQASAFTGVGPVWAPFYRQAVIGAFLTDHRNSEVALRFAYRDIEAAFDYFLSQIGPDQPFILLGHSQGSLHLTTLLHEHIAGTPIADRIAAAYIIGWPISIDTDLPEMGLPACRTAEDSHCIVAFQSFAEPSDPAQVLNIYDATTGFDGSPRTGTPILCVNPLTGTENGEADASANLGSLIPNETDDDARLMPGRVPARCDERGFLLIGAPPDGYGRYILPGNNFHVFDFALFWANLRADIARRASAFLAARE